jgi:hypothetical protein
MIDSLVNKKKILSCSKDELLNILCTSQNLMRLQKDECSFVSLRDVERLLTILDWFQTHSPKVAAKICNQMKPAKDPFTINLILSLGVAYFVRLDERRQGSIL